MTTLGEKDVRELGEELYRRMSGGLPALFSGWGGLLLKSLHSDEDLRRGLFFLIDVLPALPDAGAIHRHIEEYLAPFLSSGLFRWAGSGARFFPGLAERIGRRLIAPENRFEDSVAAFERRGRRISIDLVGEESVSHAEADQNRNRYLALLSRFERRPMKSPIHLSLKPSALNPDMNPLDPDGSARAVLERLVPILRRLAGMGGGLVLDMEQRERKEIILALFRRIQEDPDLRAENVGIALQAYLPETSKDLAELVAWGRERGLRFPVRLVKGAYWDQEVAQAQQNNWPVPVFQKQEETDAHFEKLVEILCGARDTVIPFIATHNLRTVSHAVCALGGREGISPGEVHVLHGMSEPLQEALAGLGIPVRVYVPVGDVLPGMAYLIRRLLENTANESFLRRQFLSPEPCEVLLNAPKPSSREETFSKGGPRKASPDEKEEGAFENEPFLDFSREQARTLFREGLVRVKDSLGRRLMPRIAGRETGEGEEEIRSLDPSMPARTVANVLLADEGTASRALEQAKRFREAWRETSWETRISLLLRTAEVLRSRRMDLAAAEVFETGKSWTEADADVCEAIDFCVWYARMASRLKESDLPGPRGERNRLRYEGRGVALVLPPWNFPLAIPAGMTVAALVTGNVVLLKPSLEAPLMGALLVEALLEAGVPPGAIHYLPGRGDTLGRHLAAHPEVDMVAFTGSRAVGVSLLGLIGRPSEGQRGLKHFVCEMGGKNAIVVDDDADLDLAVPAILSSAFSYQGQKCSACSRVIAVGGIHDRLVERIVRGTEALPIGSPEDPKNRIGPVISRQALERIRAYVERGRKEGELLLEREIPEEVQKTGGYYTGPAIFGDIRPHHVLAKEEIFGPVLSILKAGSFHEGIALAADSDYRLTGGVFSRSPSHIREAEQNFRVGNLYINRGIVGARVGRHPFGGLGFSGWGSPAGGPDTLLQYVTSRTISENVMRHGYSPIPLP